jgi:hypothetical protein
MTLNTKRSGRPTSMPMFITAVVIAASVTNSASRANCRYRSSCRIRTTAEIAIPTWLMPMKFTMFATMIPQMAPCEPCPVTAWPCSTCCMNP